MPRKLEFEGKVYEFPDDASDQEISQALSGAPAQPPIDYTDPSLQWETVRGPRPPQSTLDKMFDWGNTDEFLATRKAHEGFTGSAADILGVPQEGGMRSVIESAGKNVIDPLVGNTYGFLNAFLSPITKPLSPVVEPALKAESSIMGGLLPKDVTEPEPLPETRGQALSDIRAQLGSHPVSTAMAFEGMGGSSVPRALMRPFGKIMGLPERATRKAAVELSPSPSTETGQRAPEIVSNALRRISEETTGLEKPLTGNITSDPAKLKAALMETKNRTYAPVSQMLEKAKQRGVIEITSDYAIRQLEDLKNRPVYRSQPRAQARIQERINELRGERLTPEEAINKLSDLNKEMALYEEKTGLGESVAEANLSNRMKELEANAYRDSLNEKLSPPGQPNAFKEVYRDFSDVATFDTLLQRMLSKEYLAKDTNLTLLEVAKRRGLSPLMFEMISRIPFVKQIFEATPSQRIAKSIQASQVFGQPEPSPFAPQKPTTLPPGSVPPPSGGGGGQPTSPGVLSAPPGVGSPPAVPPSPAGGPSMTPPPPIVWPPGSKGPTRKGGKPPTFSDIVPGQTKEPTRAPTPGSSATEMTVRSRHPETRATVMRGQHEPVEVLFKDRADKIAFGGGKKSISIVKGETKSNLEQIKQAAAMLKKLRYPEVDERQISAAMREYNKFIVDLAKLQDKAEGGTINPLSFDEFVKTTYPSIFGPQ